MKIKSILLALSIAVNALSQSNVLSDFEGITLNQNPFYQDTLSTDFTDGILNFQYDWDNGFQYWSAGFSCSAIQDSSTSGYGNLYASKSLSGNNGSMKYAVGQQNSRISFVSGAGPGLLSSIFICNSTYAYNSMRDGDPFAKKFGGISGNDPDWFKLTIKKYLGGILQNDSIEFYLADFRFANNTQDYIVSDWTYLNTSSLGIGDSLLFTLSSSDNGTFGMNTPAFFCIDDAMALPFVGIENQNKQQAIKIYPNPCQNTIIVETNDKTSFTEEIELLDMQGKNIFLDSKLKLDNKFIYDLSKIESGIYLLKSKNETGVYVQKIIKN